jgi:hypothetical protein
MKPDITIRMGAAHYSLQVGDTFVDMAKRTKNELYEIRKGLIEPLKLLGFFGDKQARKAQYRQKAMKT